MKNFTKAAKECAQSYIDWMNKSNFYFTFAMNIMPATLLSVLPIGGMLLKAGTLAPGKICSNRYSVKLGACNSDYRLHEIYR